MNEPPILRRLRKLITLVFFLASLTSWVLNVVVIFATPGVDWRTNALAISGALSIFAFVGYYLFKKYVGR